jgi:nitroimidazol reductase NimA-like FMN-containing flavoprotein (pyridoxamine 5'-phosphate oxidase superfamily)
MSVVRPTFRDLDTAEAHQILARNHVGRIAYSFHDRVDIEPISYVYADGVIYLRTTVGSKLTTLAAPHGWHSRSTRWLARSIWQSVVAHGTVYVLEDDGPAITRASYRLAVQHLRTLNPHALDDQDPTPERNIVRQIHPATVAGLEARSIAAAPASARPAGTDD